ncbi:MAG TPA: hypothetical protein PLG90_07890 [Ignavibacteria bacterium]|nr:hypothetical protein [Ignavibacteria bacterium]
MNSAVIQVLKTFSSAEIKEFDKFVRSPFFGGSEYIYTFWNIIKKHHPGFEGKNFNKEIIFKKLYPGKPFNDGTIRKLSSELLKLAEEFIKITEFRKTKIGNRFLLITYNARYLYNMYENLWDETIKFYNSKSEFDFLNLIELHILQISRVQNVADKKSPRELFSERMKYYGYMIVYNLIILMQERMRRYLFAEIYNFKHQNIAEEICELTDFERNIKIIIKKFPQFQNLLFFNYNLMKAFEEPEKSEYFFNSKNIIKKDKNIPGKSLYFYCSIMINFCLKYRDTYKIADLNEQIIELIELLIKRNCIVQELSNTIENALIEVYVDLLIQKNKIKEAENFIEKYKKFIKDDIKENVLLHSYYLFAFHKKEYEKALEILSRMKEVNKYDKINFRIFKLILLYELKRFEEAISVVHSTEEFLRNDKLIAKDLKEPTKVFIEYYKKLLKLKIPFSKSDEREIKHFLSKEKRYLKEKKWIELKLSA